MIKKIRSKRNNAAASGETMADGGSANDLPPAQTPLAPYTALEPSSPGPGSKQRRQTAQIGNER
jgi:hypothetical protein